MSKQTISRSELLGLLCTVRKCTLATISYKTSARLRKTGCPFGQVDKLVTANVMIGADYKRVLEKTMAQRGLNPEAEIHSTWGNHLGKALIELEKDGDKSYYLESIFKKTMSTRFVEADSGRELSREQVENWLPNKLSEVVPYRRTDLKNIISIKMNKIEYQVID